MVDIGCVHVRDLRSEMLAKGIEIWSEDGMEPWGWVNVSCEQCKRTFETIMREREEDEEIEWVIEEW